MEGLLKHLRLLQMNIQRLTMTEFQTQGNQDSIFKYVIIFHHKSTSGFSLQCDEFWPKEDILLHNSPQLRHPTAGRARAPKRRLPSNQMLKQKVSKTLLADKT